jgi:serine/threonine protein kinase
MATSPEKWQTVKAWFDAALELDSSARAAFLRDNCPDAEARAEVERLLNEHDQAGRFLSTPVLGNFPLEADLPAQRLSDGEVLAGRFRIVRFIAGGGMGEVYEAEDQELRERVALKTIRPEILAQPDALTRFKREVRLARQVTHPNVCRIFDLFRHRRDEHEEAVFISMELLHGKTLSAQLEEGGRMSMGESLPLVRQMASALAAAHAAGIVHRDFKPGNVVLAGAPEQRRAVVTDFGLALRSLTSDKDATASTGDGAWGTPAYMAPEQLEGRPATTASDIYALGLVIYEMVTGARPFEGDTPISAALKRLSETPTPPRKFQPKLSPEWESVILQCLERYPAQRFASPADVVKALEVDRPPAMLSKTAAWPKPLAVALGAKKQRWGVATGAIAALFVLGAAGFGVYSLVHHPVPMPFQNFTITQVTNLGKVADAAISPDAKFVLSVNDDNGTQSLWLHNMPTASDTQITPPSRSSYASPAFSPDGNYIYFLKSGDPNSVFDLYRSPVLGGTPQTLVHDVDSDITFSPDGRRIAYVRANDPEMGKYRLLTATLDGNDEKVLQIGSAEDQVLHPAWSPSGRQIAYRVRQPGSALTGIDVFDVESGKSHRFAVFQDKIVLPLKWSPDGRGIFFNYYPRGLGGQIGWLPGTGEGFRPITRDTNNYYTLTISADGRTLATVQTKSTQNVYLLPGTGSHSPQADSLPLQVRTKADVGLTWSHDGTFLASDGTRLWRMERDGRNASLLVEDPQALIFNQSTCGGQYLVFMWSFHEGTGSANIWRANVDGSNRIRLTAGKLDYDPVCSPDQKWVYYFDATAVRIMRVLLDGSGKPEAVPGSSDFHGFISGGQMDFSANGTTFAYLVSVISTETQRGTPKVALLSLGSTNSLRLLDVNPQVSGGVQFTPDGKAVAYPTRENGVDNLWVLPLDGSVAHRITNFNSEQIKIFHWSPDGKNLALLREHSESDVVLLQETNP